MRDERDLSACAARLLGEPDGRRAPEAPGVPHLRGVLKEHVRWSSEALVDRGPRRTVTSVRVLLSWLIRALAHPQVVVDGDGVCPDPGDIERRLGTLMLPVDERERQDRAHVQRSGGGLQIDLL